MVKELVNLLNYLFTYVRLLKVILTTSTLRLSQRQMEEMISE